VTTDILLIDDDPLVRKLYETALGAHQISLATAASGAEGLERLKQGLPKLVMLDVMMPQMDGVETCRRIRETYSEPFPIMFLTATDAPSVVRNVIEAGGDDFVVKGSPLSDVLTRIRFWLSTPLRGLPRSVRRSALIDGERDTGPDGKPRSAPSNAEAFIAGVMAKSGVAKAGAEIRDPQVHAQILGYLIGLVNHLTGRGLRQALMFPDRFSAALASLAPETQTAAADLLPKIDTLLETAKVAHAVKRGHSDAEAWDRDGPDFAPEGLNFSSSID
jgi:CheY-like chemotaxis protein